MCGRSTITKTEKVIEDRFGVKYSADALKKGVTLPTYNAAPGQLLPVITNTDPDTIQVMRWGLLPTWAADRSMSYKTINARSETMTVKPAYKEAVHTRRCLIPMDGYYEWMPIGPAKWPYYITLRTGDLFAVAGLWSTWRDPSSGEVVDSYTVVTLPAPAELAHIHDRMPAILTVDAEKQWLNDRLPLDDVVGLIKPYPAVLIKTYPVSCLVGKVSNNNPELISAVTPNIGIQGSLF